MYWVSGFSTSDDDLDNAIKDKYVAQEEIYIRFGMCRGKCGVIVPEINNPTVRFTGMLLGPSLLQSFMNALTLTPTI
jgi:hypothetical protein